MQRALRAAGRRLLTLRASRGLATMLCAGGGRGGFARACGAGGTVAAAPAAARAPASALTSRSLVLRIPAFQHHAYLYRTLGAPQLTVVNVARPSAPVPSAAMPRSFEALGLQAPLVSALHGMGITEPTDIQSLSFPTLTQQPGNYFLASHTGSGKTLAYLLPLVQALKAEEAAGFVPRPKRPRVLVLGPTRELTEQITGVAKRLCHSAKFRATCANAYTSVSQQARALSGPVDVLVATPTRFLHHVREGNVAYRDIRWLVVDEADTVFGQGWGEEVAQILAPLRAKPDPAHVLLVSATLTRPVQRAIRELVPDAKEIKTSTLHRAVTGSSHQFMTLPPGGNKLQLLAEILGADSRRSQKTLVFCNTVDSCRAVEHFAREEGLPCVCYHGEMPPEERQESMATFAAASSSPAASSPASPGGPLPLMIATDLAARGLDFPGNVDHVVNFDFPTTAVDYLHRTGRTARAGNKGKITSIVSKRDKVLAQRVEYALERDEPLDGISAEKEVLPPSQMATMQREKANVKVREAEAVLGPKGMAKLRAATAARAAKEGKKGAGPGAGSGKKGGKAAAKPSLKGPVRGAARFALLEERLQRRNAEKGKSSRRPGGGGVWRGGRGGGGGGNEGR